MKITMVEQLQFLKALRLRSFTLLWIGQALSSLGNGVHIVALAWQVLLLTGSGVAMGIVLIASTLPSLVFLLIGGIIADRIPRRIVLLWSDGSRAFIVLAIAVLGWFHLLQLGHLIGMEILFGLVNGFFNPAYQSISPQLVAADDLASANALNNLSRELGFFFGPLLGAAFITLNGPTMAFTFDSLTFAISAFCLYKIRLPASYQSVIVKLPDKMKEDELRLVSKALNELHSFYVSGRDGIKFVSTSTWLWVTISISAFVNMGFTGSIQVALPKLVHDTYTGKSWLLGTISAAIALGSILGAICAGQLKRLPYRGRFAYFALLAASGGLLLLGFSMPYYYGLVTMNIAGILLGLSIGIFGVLWITLMQEHVSNDMLGRVSSIDWLGSLGLTPVGYALAGIITDSFGPKWVFLGSGLLLLLLIFGAFCIRDIRQL